MTQSERLQNANRNSNRGIEMTINDYAYESIAEMLEAGEISTDDYAGAIECISDLTAQYKRAMQKHYEDLRNEARAKA